MLQNLHVHSAFCDGADTPENIVKEAINKGFRSIGFSGHSYMHYAPEHSMSVAGTEEYKREIKRLKKKYKNELEIYLGLEADMFSDLDYFDYDYLIGSVHYLKIGKDYVGFDRDYVTVKSIIDKYFCGKPDLFAKEYYDSLSELSNHGAFDIIGHFDLITKHSERNGLFFEPTEKHQAMALAAADALRGKIPFFEVNTGAISRGYRTTPYPSVYILKELRRMGFGAVITSDCHDKRHLDCGFDDAIELLANCGYKERYILTTSGFKAVGIKEE